MISEYCYIKAYLKKKMDANNNEFRSMFLKMIKKTKMYLKEAMGCDTIVVATILNPSYRLSLFQSFFPKHYSHAKDLITNEYNKRQIEYKENITVKEIPPPVVKSKNNKRRREKERREKGRIRRYFILLLSSSFFFSSIYLFILFLLILILLLLFFLFPLFLLLFFLFLLFLVFLLPIP